jgi:hypothetical protein
MSANFGTGFLSGLLLMTIISFLSLQGCVDNAKMFDERERTYMEISLLRDKIEELKLIDKADAMQVQAMAQIAEELRQRCR